MPKIHELATPHPNTANRETTLADHLARPLLDYELASIAAAYQILLLHGSEFNQHGWSIEEVLDDRDPDACATVGESPPILLMLIAGAGIVKIEPNFIGMRLHDGTRAIKVRKEQGGCILMGEERLKFYKEMKAP